MKSRTWAYRVEWTVAGQCWTHSKWLRKYCGKPTDASLAKHVRVTEDSYRPGGVNARSGALLGVQQVLAARVVSQRTGEVVATYRAA